MRVFQKLARPLSCSFLILTLSLPSAMALDAEKIDTQLANSLNKINKLFNDQSDDYDKLGNTNLELLKSLRFIAVQPGIMSAPLKKAVNAGLSVYTSDDKKLRCYSWDTLTGGTMHVFYSLIAFDTGAGKLKCRVINPASSDAEGDPGAAFEGLDTIKTKDGKTVYLVRDLFIGSGMIHGRTIRAYIIAGKYLTNYPFFQPASKKMLNSISFDFAEYGDGTEFELSADKKTLKVPLIKPAAKDSPGSGTATGKFLNYYFDGNKFVFGKGK